MFWGWFGWFLNVKLENSLLNWALQQPGHNFNLLPAPVPGPVSLLFKIGLLFVKENLQLHFMRISISWQM